MPFWAYMLHCRGGMFYTGHTDNLELRMAQHRDQTLEGFTAQYAPCELVWSDTFPTRYEALAAELRIKGWSKAKKLALIRGDWAEISRLAKSKSGASAGSARTDEGTPPPSSVRPPNSIPPPSPVRAELVEAPLYSSRAAPAAKNGPSTSSGRTAGGETSPSSVRAELVEAPFLSPNGGSLQGSLAAASRLDKALADATGLSRERVKALIAAGAVTVGRATAGSPSAKVTGGTPYTIALPPTISLAAEPQDIPLVVAFEDEHLIVVDKPAGMVVHPAAGNLDGTLVNALLHHCAGRLSGINGVARPGIVHRIDKDTSGLLVVAKSDAAHEGLAAQFAKHSIDRRYLAVCAGHPNPGAGTIATRIGRSDSDRKKMAVLPDDSSRGKRAVTHYRTLRLLEHAALIECRLETGRTHQVRVHCASIGHPLLGDPVYGRTPKDLRALLDRLDFRRQALHAAELGFTHPVSGERVHFQADLPLDMSELIDEAAR